MHFDCHTGMSDATLTTALISITCVLVVISVLTFIASLVGQCYLRRKPAAVTKNSESSKSGPATEQVEDLKQKDNNICSLCHPASKMLNFAFMVQRYVARL